MKKKIFSILLICILVIGLTGCEKDTSNENHESSNNINASNEKESKTNETVTEKETGNYVYMFNTTQRMKIGTEPSKYGTYYTTAEEAMKEYGYDMTIRHTLVDGKIKESYVGFKHKGKIYFIKGQDTTIYESNKKELQNIFGSSNCSETKDYFNCTDDQMGVIIRKDGSTEAGFDKQYCISYDDFAKCGTH